ncbi:MAG: radical SAM protein [Candidatus Nezhaarchaeales archaeon]
MIPWRYAEKRFVIQGHFDPYLGCAHGCRYCAAKYTLGLSDEGWRAHRLHDYGSPRLGANKVVWNPRGEVLERPIGKNVCVGQYSDPYQPAEKELMRTRKLLEELRGLDLNVLVRTKSDLVKRDVELFTKRFKLAVSVTHEPGYAQAGYWEPFAPSADKRVETVKFFAEAGIPVEVYLQPLLPGSNPVKVVELLRDYADIFVVNLMYEREWVGIQLLQRPVTAYEEWSVKAALELMKYLHEKDVPFVFERDLVEALERRVGLKW